jgi:protein gp37
VDIAVGKNFPLRNVWLSASVEDQKTANERRQPMRALARDGWLTWVSYEPALQAVDWTGWEFIKWLVAGGESGPEARPNHGRWFRAAARFWFMEKIPFFFKQHSEWIHQVDLP